MGVKDLWKIVHPVRREIKLETLNRKRLAVDASIWIYQFLKAVRDKEGNALRNSHVVGFFRRICKLLFFGIKPVFVFDGGAPALKRETISGRKRRREGRREDAVRTAGRLLAVQMQRRAEEEEERMRGSVQQHEEEVVPDEGLVYVDEIGMNPQQRQQSRKFKKKDQYHLPDLDVSLNEMGGPNDPRIMSLEELQQYARQFDTGEDINVYDFSKIDYDSPFFTSLPASDRYNILNAARLRSRLRMGHSKEQLDTMFPDRMEFSRFQIERVTERNELTQRLMHLNDGGDIYDGTGLRVAGERGREYVLVKNDGVEGGWALGVISEEGERRETAIDVDKPAPEERKVDDGEWESEEEFEDVPVEGLNRLPKRRRVDDVGGDGGDGAVRQRGGSYKSRRGGARRKPRRAVEANPLFVTEDVADENEEEEEQWEEIDTNAELFGEPNEPIQDEDEAELQRAIAMSLESNNNNNETQSNLPSDDNEEEDNDMFEIFQQTAAPEAAPLPKGSGRSIANIVNKRAFDAAPESREVTSFGVPTLKAELDQQGSDEDDDEAMDFQAALAESRRGKRKVSSPPQQRRNFQPASLEKKKGTPNTEASADTIAKQAGFSGPLPFEKLDLGSSLLGKKKMIERSEETAGGFINAELERGPEKKDAEPLPPWFAADTDVAEGIERQKAVEREERERARQERRNMFQFEDVEEQGLGRMEPEIIDLEAEEERPQGFRNGEVIDLVEGDDDAQQMELVHGAGLVHEEVRMGDLAERVRVEPPAAAAGEEDHPAANEPVPEDAVPMEISDAQPNETTSAMQGVSKSPASKAIAEATKELAEPEMRPMNDNDNNDDEEMIEWSDSEGEHEEPTKRPTAVVVQRLPSRSPSADFEDVQIPNESAKERQENTVQDGETENDPVPAASDTIPKEFVPDENDLVDLDDDFSDADPEEEELLLQLTKEAEEHARFASTLNNKTHAQNIADYERELRQLRNQQKKDRRDADEVTHIMITECQQLLRLFGLPYVTAPMEAEAQCAELVRLGLVDGIVTDDSDCFLFGGTRIYKNMFNQDKFVECYLTSDMEGVFGLTRAKLIQLAHLLGSDYTEGLPGVGFVQATEIAGEFETLQDFTEWWNGVQMQTIPKSDDTPVRKKFRKAQATKLFLPPAFPDTRVDIAYQNPDVDSDPEPFQWGVPDLDALRTFLMATIGWSQERTDEVLVPVIRDMNRRADEGTQSNITAFFEGGVGIGAAGAAGAGRGEVFAPRRRAQEGSKRMGSALTSLAEKARRGRGKGVVDGDGSGMNGVGATEGSENQNGTSASGGKKQKNRQPPTKRRKKADSASATASNDEDGSEFDGPQPAKKKRAAPGKGRKNRTQAEVD